MKKIFYLLVASLGLFTACTDEDKQNLDVYSLDSVTVDFAVTELPHDTVVAGVTYNLNSWKVVATIKGATAYRYSAQLSYPDGEGISSSKSLPALTQVVSYAKAGDYKVVVTVNSNGGSRTFEQVISQTYATGLPMTDEEIAVAKKLLWGKTYVLDSKVVGHLANAYWAANPGDKATSECYDDEFTFNDDFTFTCNTNGKGYGDTSAKDLLALYPGVLAYDKDESQYDLFFTANESARPVYKYKIIKQRDYVDADPTKDTKSFYIKFSSDDAYLGYFSNRPSGRYFQIYEEDASMNDGDDNTIDVRNWGYANGLREGMNWRQERLIVKNHIRVNPKDPDGVYNLKETFEGNFLGDYNYKGSAESIIKFDGLTYLYPANDWRASLVADPTNPTIANKVVKINRAAEEKWGHLFSPKLPVPINVKTGLVVTARVYVPSTNVYKYSKGDNWNSHRENWSWQPYNVTVVDKDKPALNDTTMKDVKEFINLRVRIENPSAKAPWDGDESFSAWTTRVESEINLADYLDQWVTVQFPVSQALLDTYNAAAAGKNGNVKKGTEIQTYLSVGLMFGREGYYHDNELNIYYDDIVITTPDKLSGANILKSGGKVLIAR